MKNTSISTLWKKYKSEKKIIKKEQLEKKIVEYYFPFVKRISYKLCSKIRWRLSPDELSSFGVDGLYTAIRRFDTKKGVKFETYASTRIYGSMVDGMRKEDLIPRSVRINNRKFEKTKAELESKEGRSVTDIEIIEEMGINERDYFINMKKYNPVIFSSLEGIPTEEGEGIKKDFNTNLIDKKNNYPDHKIKRNEFFNKLLSKNFSEIEREIIFLYYYEDLTMDLIAEILDMSESRISQIHKDVLPRLKEKIKRNPKYFSVDVYS
ncbi:MAG TPA: sigma-70 family RNA polymerase sigma factor, partial [Candidatus Paceibacterota bacterium]|nr:sigma-70 family RNA polymerase sigma factor [Candidatus Paceibacterota bacterium]